MNNELQSQLASILASIQSAASASADFAMEQLPEIAQQYVLYARVVSGVRGLFLLALAVAAFAYARYAYKHPWNTSGWAHERERLRSDSNEFVAYLGPLIGVALLALAVWSFNWMAWLAPKVWLLKELAQLAEGK